jgi:hypothetical protein
MGGGGGSPCVAKGLEGVEHNVSGEGRLTRPTRLQREGDRVAGEHTLDCGSLDLFKRRWVPRKPLTKARASGPTTWLPHG